MRRFYINTLILIALPIFAQAQFPRWNWADYGFSLWQTYSIRNDATCDRDGNYYLTGYFSGGMRLPGDSTNGNIQGNGKDMFIFKMNADGTLAWAEDEGGFPDENRSFTVTTDDNNTVFYGGFFEGEGYFGNQFMTSAGSDDGVVIARNDDGSVRWKRQFSNASWATCRLMRFNQKSDVIIQGEFSGSLNIPGANLSDTGNYTYFLAALRANNGNLNWARTMQNAPFAYVRTMETDDEGNTYISFTNVVDTADWTIGNTTLPPADNQSSAIVKFDTDGEIVWAKRGYARYLVRGSNGHMFLIGEGVGTHVYDGVSISLGGATDPFIIEIDANGDLVDYLVLTGNTDQIPTSVSADDSGHVYIHGRLEGSMNVGGMSINVTKQADYYLCRLDQNLNSNLLISTGGENFSQGHMRSGKYPFVNLYGSFSVDQNVGGFPIIVEGTSSYYVGQIQTDSIFAPVDTTDTTGNDTSGIGIQSFHLTSDFNVYPNPAHDHVTIETDRTNNISMIVVRDVLGRRHEDVVVSVSLHKIELNTSVLSKGNYFIELYEGPKVHRLPLLIQ